MLTFPAGTLTASVLFDVLSLVADSPEQADSFQHRAADLLRIGLGSSLSSVALEVADFLRAPGGATPAHATRKFAANGAVIAIYLLDVAARQKQLRDGHARAEPLPLALSLLGLVFLGVSGKLR